MKGKIRVKILHSAGRLLYNQYKREITDYLGLQVINLQFVYKATNGQLILFLRFTNSTATHYLTVKGEQMIYAIAEAFDLQGRFFKCESMVGCQKENTAISIVARKLKPHLEHATKATIKTEVRRIQNSVTITTPLNSYVAK